MHHPMGLQVTLSQVTLRVCMANGSDGVIDQAALSMPLLRVLETPKNTLLENEGDHHWATL